MNTPTPRILVANRGAIACRILRTLQQMQLPAVAVYSEADHGSLHVGMAETAICLGPAPAAESYLDIDKVLQACRGTGATAVHPGYGFLSENTEFARRLEEAGITFIGPTPEQIISFGLKHEAKALAKAAGVPLLPGTGLLGGVEEALEAAAGMGYPVMLKSTAGGGGIGMRVCRDAAALRDAYEAVSALAARTFKDAGLFLEKYVVNARHIEVQVFGDGAGRVIALGERDCSVQRRNQKVIEETPAPGLDAETRGALAASAIRLAKSVNYRSAGTVEFVLDVDSGEFYFLEVNTRLQVEHGVTEEIYGVDLVGWMIRLALGDSGMFAEALQPRGHSIQARIYAEAPHRNFQPSAGRLIEACFPEDIRVETWVERGTVVPAAYDPMIAKLIVHADTREAAIRRLHAALCSSQLAGIETNLEYLAEILEDGAFTSGKATTRMLADFAYLPHCMDVIEGGAMTTVQDYPGRTGHWDVGVPPSGPMDDASFRLANRLLGNPEGAPALEMTHAGPTLLFHCDTVVALTGARVEGDLPMDQPVAVKAGQTLRLRRIQGAGCRAYLAVLGGIECPEYLGSRATFTLGGFGGPAGRALRAGDVLHLPPAAQPVNVAVPQVAAPDWGHHWNIRVLFGPHGDPDFFTAGDIQTFFATDWKVHYNSNPTGIRLVGPKPVWARADGGEAGLHPSNIHDNPYAVGAIDFTGDMPIILGPDGPSLGGFVCPAVIVRGDRWMMGQLRPDDTVRFIPVTLAEALEVETALNAALDRFAYPDRIPERPAQAVTPPEPAVLALLPETPQRPAVCYRVQGDRSLLVEYGPLVLDFDLRMRAHALMECIRSQALPGVADLTPGIRSLQIHYDPLQLPRDTLLAKLQEAEDQLGDTLDLEITSRVVYLPLSWDDPATRLAIEKYTQSVRPDAPWCPSNIEFIRRINGLESLEAVREIVYQASYMVLGLGDVYLGAPVATPLDPRHRLVTTKYNPARTWTAENSVGIGGAYMCIYGMEGPGGYQFVGRTLQVWNSFKQTADFQEEKPWLLRFFDQIRFYPVSAEELLALRRDFPLGRHKLRIETERFRLRDYHAFLEAHAEEIVDFRLKQRQAFAEERERWALLPPPPEVEAEAVQQVHSDPVPEGCEGIVSPLSGSLWKLNVSAGEVVEAGQVVAVIEAMKMETGVPSPCAGVVKEVFATAGKAVTAGQILIVIEAE